MTGTEGRNAEEREAGGHKDGSRDPSGCLTGEHQRAVMKLRVTSAVANDWPTMRPPNLITAYCGRLVTQGSRRDARTASQPKLYRLASACNNRRGRCRFRFTPDEQCDPDQAAAAANMGADTDRQAVRSANTARSSALFSAWPER